MTYDSEVLADSPTVFWKLDDASGTTAVDASGNGNDGTYHNGPALAQTGLIVGETEHAVAFTADPAFAAQQYVKSNATLLSGSVSALTLECIVHWANGVQVNTDPTPVAVVDPTNASDYVSMFFENSGGWRLVGSATVDTLDAIATSFTDGTYHLALTFDATHVKLYVNGALVATGNCSGAATFTPAANLWAATDATDPDGFQGKIEKVAIYPTALSAARVLAHAAAAGSFAGASIGPLDAGVAAHDVAATHITTPASAAPGFPDVWSFTVADPDGVVYGALQTANATAVRWAHLAPTEVDLECSLDDPGLVELADTLTPPREVQVYLNGHLLCWGKPTVRRADGAHRRYAMTIKDPAWYLSRRNIGSASPPEFLQNPDFESGTGHWSAAGGVTFTAATDRPLVGTHSAKLVQTVDGADAYISQTFVRTAGSIGLAVYLTAWVYIDSWSGPALASRGLYLARVGHTGPGALSVATVAPDTPRGIWQKMTVVVNMPPNVTETIEARLYAPNGTVHWDAAHSTEDDSLTFSEVDQALIVSRLITYAQGKGPLGYLSPEKSDCRIRVDCPATGVLKTRSYHFDEHQRIYDGGAGLGALDEYLKAADGLEWRMEYTTTTRTLRTQYPRVGTTWAERFTWRNFPDEPERNASWALTGWTYGSSLESAANQVVELNGWGGGSSSQVTRDEAGYSNPASLGGLTLELVETAPDTSPLGTLQSLADARGAQLENAAVTPTLSMREPRDPVTDEVTTMLVGVLLPGDTIPVDVEDGPLTMAGNFRVAALTLDPSTMELTATVVPT